MRCKFIFFLLACYLNSPAQMPEYFVDLYIGSVQILKPGKKPVQVKNRTLLFREDKILLKKDGDQVTLLNKEAEYLILNKKGVYSIADLTGFPRRKSAGITKRYAELVLEELLRPSSIGDNARLKNIAGSNGGVDRGACDFVGGPENNIATADQELEFSWMPIDSTVHYRFSLLDEHNNELLGIMIRDTVFRLSNNHWLPEPENNYYWQVKSVENDCGDMPKYKLNWLTDVGYAKKSEELIKSVNKNNYTHYNLEICKILYDNGFYKLATTYFKKALEGELP